MKILVFSKNWIGDVVFQLPALDALHRSYPQAELVCIAPERCHGILKMHDAVSQVLDFDEKSTHRSIFSKIHFMLDLKKQGPWDLGVLFHKSKTRAWIFKCAGVVRRVGYGKGRAGHLTDPVKEPEHDMHHVLYHLHLLSEAGIQTEGSKEYRLSPTTVVQAEMDERLTQLGLTEFGCFHLGANWEPKRWPVEHWVKLCDFIWDKYKLPIILTGGPGDQPLADALLDQRKSAQIVSLMGETSLEQLAGLFKKSKFLVTADSGPMHIASAVGCTVLALFGPTNPDFTGPLGVGKKKVLSYVPEGFETPFLGKHFPEEGWMDRILPEDAFAALEELVFS